VFGGTRWRPTGKISCVSKAAKGAGLSESILTTLLSANPGKGFIGLSERGLVKLYSHLDHSKGFMICPSDNHFVAVADDFDVARAGEKDHGAWMFVDSGFVGNFLYIDIEDAPHREVDGFGVHEITFEEKLDPTPILRDAENQASGISDTFDQFFA
jgi:hypothetical protein